MRGIFKDGRFTYTVSATKKIIVIIPKMPFQNVPSMA